jgi:hypothetical protein
VSIGPGRIQSAIIDILTDYPEVPFSVWDLATIIFDTEEVSADHTGRISRALNSPALTRRIKLYRSRVGNHRTGGWHYVYGIPASLY